MALGADGLTELGSASFEEVAGLRSRSRLLWLDVTGVGDVQLVQRLGELFELHRLTQEDIVNVHQRAKAEEYPGYAFLVLRMLDPTAPCDTEQFALCLGPGFVVTFQERAGDCFATVRQRLRDPQGRLQRSGADHLAYALIDAIVDAYFPVLEQLGDRLDSCEEDILLGRPHDRVLGSIHALRRDLLVLRRALWPLRELSAALLRGDSPRFQPDTRLYLRDLHDHVIQLLDLLENQREMAAALMEVHLSSVSNRLNEVMKVLTIIATIFIPLTFVAGIYGMNFDEMPELRWQYGYYACLLVMAAIAVGMLWWFHRRRWL